MATNTLNTKTRSHARLAASQGGMSLVVVLMFLVMLTLVGATSMQSASVEERMASNSRDRAIAFEAAEVALRIGEKETVKATCPSSATWTASCSAGLCSAAGAPTDPNSYTHWAETSATVIKHNPVLKSAPGNQLPPDLAYDPGYYAECLGRLNLGTAYGGYKNVIRVTAHAPGRDANTQVTLQSVIYQEE